MIVILILLIIIAALLWLYATTTKKLLTKLKITNKIKQGYEKNYNTFRMKYTILSKLENTEQVIQKVKQLDRPLYIYGGGVIGDKFLSILRQSEEIDIIRVLESSEFKADPELGKNLQKNALIIITPMFDYDNIVSLLKENCIPNSNIIGLDEFIN